MNPRNHWVLLHTLGITPYFKQRSYDIYHKSIYPDEAIAAERIRSPGTHPPDMARSRKS